MTRAAIFFLSTLSMVLVMSDRSAAASPCREAEDARSVCRHWENYLIPSGLISFYAPNASDFGSFVGGGIAIDIAMWSHNRDTFGPSQGTLFVSGALLRSQNSSSTMSLFESGMTASFERNASRRWMIPYYGLLLGKMSHGELPDGWFSSPLAGIHVFWDRAFSIDLRGGYDIPLSHVDRLRGPRAQLLARVSFW